MEVVEKFANTASQAMFNAVPPKKQRFENLYTTNSGYHGEESQSELLSSHDKQFEIYQISCKMIKVSEHPSVLVQIRDHTGAIDFALSRL